MGKPNAPATPPVNPNPDWQDRDISLHALVVFTVLIFGVTIMAFIGMSWMYHATKKEQPEPVSPMALERSIPTAGPLLQVDPDKDLANYHAGEEKKLSTYGWVDKKAQVVHIPIEQAMKQFMEEQK